MQLDRRLNPASNVECRASQEWCPALFKTGENDLRSETGATGVGSTTKIKERAEIFRETVVLTFEAVVQAATTIPRRDQHTCCLDWPDGVVLHVGIRSRLQAVSGLAFTRIQKSDWAGKDVVLRCQPVASVDYPDIVPRWIRFGIRRIDRSQSIDAGMRQSGS